MTDRIESVDQIVDLWTRTYNAEGRPDWSHILPYYADDIRFKDSIQEIVGIDEFKSMTERLANRSQKLRMQIVQATMHDNVIFMEWEMTLIFKKRPESVVYGMSRVTLNDEGRIAEQRDYYDLWGDIFDNIPFMAKRYRRFMRKKFG